MKKILLLLLAFVSIFTLTACYGDTEEGNINTQGLQCDGTSATPSLSTRTTSTNYSQSDYRSQSNSEIISNYGSYITDYISSCEETRSSYLQGYSSTTLSASGNPYWWNAINSTNPDSHCSIFTSDYYQYSLSGTLENSDYLVTGVNFFSPYTFDYTVPTQILSNILNTLLEIEDITDTSNNITIYMNNTDHIRLPNVLSHITITTDINEDYDLFMAHSPTTEQVNDALSKSKPMYVAYNVHWADDESHKLFDITLGKATADTMLDINITDINEEFISIGMTEVLELMELLENDAFDLSFNSGSNCSDDGSGCNWSRIYLNTNYKNLQVSFFTPITSLSNSINAFDEQGIDIFSIEGAESLKAALAFADNLRSEVVYDFERFATTTSVGTTYSRIDNHTDFFKALYADQVINYSRPDNVLYNDLGTYSPNEDEIQALDTIDTSICIDLDIFDDITATGIYLKAGQSTTITRTDSNPEDTTIYINYQRNTGSKRIFSTGANSYDRPYLTRSNAIPLPAGESITISTPKGGQLFVQVPDNTNSDEVRLDVQNVLLSPLLTSFDTVSIDNFLTELETTPFNFVDIITEDMQLHSRTDFIKTSMETYNKDLYLFTDYLNTYFIGKNYYYAGIISSSIERSDNIVQFFEDRGLTVYSEGDIHRRRTQHFYADEANCGYMCSSNLMFNGTGPLDYSPIDSNKAFDPIYWGENHELGHNLQAQMTMIYGFSTSIEVSNNIHPLYIAREHALATGSNYYDTRFYYSDVFSILKQDILAGTAVSSSTLWTSSSVFNRLAFYEQLTFATNDNDFYPKLGIMTRILTEYTSTEQEFLTIRNGLGLSTYSYAEYKSMNSNDWMAIVSSLVGQRDLSTFFEGFGVSVSTKAKTQINSMNYTKQALGKVMYYVPTNPDNAMEPLAEFWYYDNKDDYLINIATGGWINPVN